VLVTADSPGAAGPAQHPRPLHQPE